MKNKISSMQVKYLKTHCGHAHDIVQMKIDKKTRTMIEVLYLYVNKQILSNV